MLLQRRGPPRPVAVPRGSYGEVMGAVLREVSIDCIDPRRVAEFWGNVLGWDVQQQDEMFWMSESGRPLKINLETDLRTDSHPDHRRRWTAEERPGQRPDSGSRG